MNIKCVVVGDGREREGFGVTVVGCMAPAALQPSTILARATEAVGKTSLLTSFVNNTFPEDYVPTIFENTSLDTTIDGTDVKLALWDTAGQEDFDRLRPLSYPGADVFLLCFAVNHKSSADNIKAKWVPELHHYCPRVPIVLVGTKLDIRQKKDKHTDPKQIISRSTGERIARTIKAYNYIECSARTQEGLKDVFNEVMRAAMGRTAAVTNKSHSCVLL